MMTMSDLSVQPGEWYFGLAPGRISTLLGSCVAVSVWHPILRCGGLCHYLLPNRPKSSDGLHMPNARYGVDALELMRCEMILHAPLSEYHVGCFGGSVMFQGNQKVGEANAELARKWMRLHELTPKQQALGGNKGRKIKMDLATGAICIDILDVEWSQGAGI